MNLLSVTFSKKVQKINWQDEYVIKGFQKCLQVNYIYLRLCQNPLFFYFFQWNVYNVILKTVLKN